MNRDELGRRLRDLDAQLDPNSAESWLLAAVRGALKLPDERLWMCVDRLRGSVVGAAISAACGKDAEYVVPRTGR